jgi:predicted adenylyl cyclase CyaB
MIEVEVKARFDLDRAQDILDLIGIYRVGLEDMVDIYFDTPALSLNDRGEALRLRKDASGSWCVFKGQHLSDVSRSRMELTIPCDFKMREVLNALGYKNIAVIYKTRKTFIFNDVEICLDTINQKSSFLEFEVMAKDESDIKRAEELIFETAALFGLGKDDFIHKSYLDIILGDSE